MSQLVEFSVGNFRSIRDRVHLSMVATKKLASEHSQLDHDATIDALPDDSLLRSAAIYGANASGKSNLVAAMRVMKRLVLNSSKESAVDQPIDVEPFRLGDQAEKPSFFEVVFLLSGETLRYGFEVSSKRVHAEWLFIRKSEASETTVFTRTEEGIEVSSSRFGDGKGLEERTRMNALFLSVVAQFNGKLATSVQRWFSNSLKIISGLNDAGYVNFTVEACENANRRAAVLDFVRAMDVGIDGIAVSKVPFSESVPPGMPPQIRELLTKLGNDEVARVATTHRRFDRDGNEIGVEVFDIAQHESEGTKKIFALAGPILDTLAAGRVLLIDELDARLHPLITRALISLFNSRKSNSNDAQLIFTTHDTSNLQRDILRRDQVWFVEKDRGGGTSLYSLLEYKPRNDSALAKNYVQGRYGAVPFIGDLGAVVASFGSNRE